MKTFLHLLLFSLCILSGHMAFAQNDSAIYGVVRSDQTGALSLSKINTTNGRVTVISQTAFPSPYHMNSIATIDTKNNSYYLFTNNRFTGVDILTGTVTTNTTLSITNPNYLEMMQYNRFDSTFYAMRYTNGWLYLVKVNTATGLVTDITTNPLSASYYMNSLAAIDPYRKRYYIQVPPNPGRLYGFDLVSGNVVLNTVLDASVYDFQLMRFNPKDSVLYGIATPMTSANKYLAKLNPLSGAVTLLTNTPFTTPLSFNAIATLDPDKGIYYLQINNQLLGYDLSSGNLIINTPLTFPFPGRFDLMVYCLDCKNETPYGQVPSISIQIAGLSENCIPQTVLLTSAASATPAATYSWSSNPSGAVSFIPGTSSSTVQAVFAAAGTYTISCTATNYLGSDTDAKSVSVSGCTSLKESTSSSDNILLTPNPSSGIVHITETNGQPLTEIRVYDALGKNIITIPQPLHTGDVLIDLSAVESGIYFINFLSGNETLTKKIIICHER